jgi:YD repeat-containing protein
LQRLTSEAYTSSASGENYSDVYTFDLANNRMSKVHTGPGGGANDTITYAYNGDDELTNQTSSLSGNTTNTYDANGSLTTSTAGGVTSTYTYDARNKMVGYSSGSVVAAYVYDDAGNRVQETVNGVTTYYLTDTQNPTGYAQPLEQKSSPTATPSVTYFLGDRVFAQADSTGNVTYLLPDGHGSTSQLANSSGTVTAAFQYDAFGTALNFTPSSAGTVFLFGGDAVYEPASGTYFHGDGVRQTLGFLFIQRDTSAGLAEDPLSLHKYLYANGSPVNNSDPSGHGALALGTLGSVAYGVAMYAKDALAGYAALAVAGALVGAIAYVEYSELSLANNLGNFSSSAAGAALQLVVTLPALALFNSKEKGSNYITEQVKRLVHQNPNLDPCAILKAWLKAAKSANDSARVEDIQKAQKYMGCRHKGGD